MAALISLAVLGLALVGLGHVQYLWIGQVANAQRQHIRSGMEFAAHHFSDEFDHELTRIFFAFQVPLPEATPDHFLRLYDQWAAATRDPRLVHAIYFLPPNHSLQLIDPSTRSMRPTAWPASLAALQSSLAGEVAGRRPSQPIVPGVLAIIVPCGGMRKMMMDHHMAALAFPRMPVMPPDEERAAFTIVELDRDYVTRVMLPDLTHRYFDARGGRDYEVEIVEQGSGRVLYRSDVPMTAGGAPSAPPFRADLTVPMFSVRTLRREPIDGLPMREPPLEPPLWNLLVRHHDGSLEDVVAATRRRNLLLAGGILVVLAGSVLALAMMLRSAERLRMQQLEFVAGVTHELNTPVAALTSAGQNLADGIIIEPSQVARYGEAIVKESRRLTEMIGQVLAYGGMQSRRKLPLVPVDVAVVIDEAVAACRWMADEQSVAIETDIDRDLPLIDGDAASLARAVQNLIANAVRHGAAGKWVAVRASADGKSVVISVEDRGPGIAARDLPHLFEPFYRGRGADRVRGSGLGLTIVKQIASAHGGSVTVDRRRDGGAIFTLRLPAHDAAVAVPEIAQHA